MHINNHSFFTYSAIFLFMMKLQLQIYIVIMMQNFKMKLRLLICHEFGKQPYIKKRYDMMLSYPHTTVSSYSHLYNFLNQPNFFNTSSTAAAAVKLIAYGRAELLTPVSGLAEPDSGFAVGSAVGFVVSAGVSSACCGSCI